MRGALEELATDLACQRITDEELRELSAAEDHFQKVVKNGGTEIEIAEADEAVRRSEQRCIIPRTVPEPERPSSIASASVRPAPAAAYGLASYAICVRLQPRLSPSLHPAPNSIGQLMNARFSLGAKFNVITREKEIAGYIYLFILWA